MKNFRLLSYIIACVCAVFCLGTLPASAEQNNENIPIGGGAAVTGQIRGMGYAAKLYNSDNGLPTSDANTVFTSSEGYLWIGGYSGLIRYDGTSFERQDSTSGITSVNAIFEDSKGRLWVGTNDNGIIYIRRDESRHYSYSDGLESSSIDTFAEDSEGNIIVGTRQGLYYIDESLELCEIGDSQTKHSYVTELVSDKNGDVCGITNNGAIFRIKNLRVTDYYNGSDIGIDGIHSILPSKDAPDEVLLGTDSGLICRGSFADSFADLDFISLYYKEHISNEEENGGEGYDTLVLSTEPVNRLHRASGRIWALTNSRIFFSDEQGEYQTLDNIPLNSGIEKMTEDWEGNLWFASRRQGVMKVAANKFLDLHDRSGLERRVVNTTCKHGDMIYIGTDTGLQITDMNYKPVKNKLTDMLTNTRIRCITEDKDGNLWISTFTNDLGLICCTADEQIISYTEENGLPSNKVRCTAPLSDGTVLAATNGGLAVIRSSHIFRTIDERSGLGNTVILTAEEYDGKYYLGTDGDGIYVSDGNKITHLFRDDGLTSDVIMRIKKDPERDVLWIVTSNSIEFVRDGVIHNIANFPYTNNYDIYFDRIGNAWVLSSNGIYVANAKDMLEKETFDYVFYNVSNGLASVPTSNSYSFLDSSGDLYISGRTGVSLVNIDNYFVQTHDIKFDVPYIEAEDKKYYPNENNVFEIPSSAKNITIYGYALTYMMHDPQIQYYLVGADDQPITVNKSAMSPVRYTNLSGGSYEFLLSLIDSSSHTVRQTAAFTIIKKRAFFEQWWFYTLCAAAVTALIMLLIYLILRRKTAVFRKREIEQKKQQRLFEQTATALVNAIDAKDAYTHGHSSRVAEYSRKLAELAGKTEKECGEIYYAALLHDVGKIGVPGNIINKAGRLDDEEYRIIKQHPAMGAQILQSINEYPYLSIGAHYHHERYDGKGYPEGLKGTDIPEIARIVSVADAYDAMTSKRSYRDPIPQQKVREEFVKGAGTQFDPELARLMLHLIDLDTEYEMKEREEIKELSGKNELIIGEYMSGFSDGIALNEYMTVIRMKVSPIGSQPDKTPIPSLILFDSLDAHIHTDERDIKDLLYFEYGEIWLEGRIKLTGARKMQSNTYHTSAESTLADGEYKIEGLKLKDHVLIRITSKDQTAEVIAALPDNSRFAYIGLTGEYCRISEVKTEKADEPSPANYIPRIAEEISFINVPAGDIPNIEADGYRTDHSEGIPIKDGMQISFFARALPTARLVWHCPYIDIFSSDDGKVNSESYHDIAFFRLDGECWQCDDNCPAAIIAEKNNSFDGWDAWKQFNKDGYPVTITFKRTGRKITAVTENAGISIKFSLDVHSVEKEVYAALTGDQCAITDIRITSKSKKE